MEAVGLSWYIPQHIQLSVWFVHYASSGEGEPTRRDGGWDPTKFRKLDFGSWENGIRKYIHDVVSTDTLTLYNHCYYSVTRAGAIPSREVIVQSL